MRSAHECDQNDETLSNIQQRVEAQDKMLNKIKDNIEMLYQRTTANAITIQHQDDKWMI